MHYTIRYNQPTVRARREAALNDCRDYLGDRFPRILAILREQMPCRMTPTDYRGVRIALSFVGIQGRYPVAAMVRAARSV